MGWSSEIAKGALAGAFSTLVMDLVWFSRYRQGGGEDTFAAWEFATSTTSFDEAAAPGKVGRRLADAVGIELADEVAGRTSSVMHWLTGVGYGIGHALLQDGRGLARAGLTTGAGAFANSYATLGAMGIYDPIWDYDRETLTEDLTAHVAFGAATRVAYRVLTDRGDRG
ncbi:MAG: hypothetical protein WEB03_08735 [Nitriliruptor sp.]|uniref:hypothetical protein n=1 Tax=Nitriliruptor sp. TaxID=2448056 RepID=UPI0034A05ACF